MVRVQSFEGEGEGRVLGGKILRSRRLFDGSGSWRLGRSGRRFGLGLFLYEAQLEPGVEAQGGRPYGCAFLFSHEIQDVPARLAAEAVPGIFQSVYLELARGPAFAKGTRSYEILSLSCEGREESVTGEHCLHRD